MWVSAWAASLTMCAMSAVAAAAAVPTYYIVASESFIAGRRYPIIVSLPVVAPTNTDEPLVVTSAPADEPTIVTSAPDDESPLVTSAPTDEPPLVASAPDEEDREAVTVCAELSINRTAEHHAGPLLRQLANVTDTTLYPGDSRTLYIHVPHQERWGEVVSPVFTLRVILTGAVEATHARAVSQTAEAPPPRHRAAIQLDKPVYKPGQTVRLRVVAVDGEVRPYRGHITVDVKDAKGNHLRRWSREETEVGVVALSMELSSQPPLGTWRVEASLANGAATASNTFNVEEYVLPKWSTDLTLPSYLERSKKLTLRGSVTAEYTYGEGVNGSALITIRRPESYSYYRCECEREDADKNLLRRQTVPLTGKKTDFSIDFALGEEYAYRLDVHAAVTEAVSGEVRNETGSVSLVSEPYNVHIHGDGPVKPGLPYLVTVRVTRYNNEPLLEFDSREVVVGYYMRYPAAPQLTTPPTDSTANTIIVSPKYDPEEYIKKSYTIPANGTVSVTLQPPVTTEEMRVQVHYDGKQRSTEYFYVYKAVNNAFINLHQSSEQLRIGESGMFRVNCSIPIHSFTYIVSANPHGLVTADYVTVDEPKAVIDFEIPIMSEMAPDAKITVFFGHEGEVVADSIPIKVADPRDFDNEIPVSIEFNKTREQPGASIQLAIRAAPSSFIGVSAIDTSVKLLGYNNHEIRKDQFFTEGGGYRSGPDSNENTQEELRYAGLIMFTDAVVYDGGASYPVYYSAYDGGFAARSGDRVVAKGSSARVAAVSAQSSEAVVENVASPSRVRKFFPETWLWLNTTTDGDGVVNINSIVPDTITSYVATAFSMSDDYGLLISKQANLEVFRSFFISLSLPYAVIRGEDAEVKVYVFNYLSGDKEVSVILQRSDEFETMFSDVETKSEDLSKTVSVGRNGAQSVSFIIRPLRVGLVKLKVLAQTDVAADTVLKDLLVKPEGVTVYKNDAIFIDVENGEEWQQYFTPQFPEEAVEDSHRLEVSVAGDIMGATVKSSGNLLRMPRGCGEQNLVNFAPNIYITNYLNTTSQLTPEIRAKAERFMLDGYQRQLTYQREDGSFSAFGDNDVNGSVWLTAFVIKSFVEATPHMFVSQEVLDRAASWLVSKQRGGKLVEVGRIISRNIQGGSSDGVALTAYVLIALKELEAELYFLDSENESDRLLHIREQTGSSMRYLEDRVDKLSNGYEVAIVAYALHLANSDLQDIVYDKLLSLAVTDQNDLTYWRGEEEEFDEPPVVIFDSWLRTTARTTQARIRAVDIEATSYALLTMAYRADVEMGSPALRWLSRQRNSLGGFRSTQDTVLGLQALSEFATLVYDPDTELAVGVLSDERPGQVLEVRPENRVLLQSVVVPGAAGVGELALTARGHGTALLQVATSYNVVNGTAGTTSGAFSLHVTSRVSAARGGGRVKLTVCAAYLLPGSSNMAVLEVAMPSGYTADVALARRRADTDLNVQRAEGAEGNTRLNLYFNSLTHGHDVCVHIQGDREFRVRHRKPAAVTIYDYYDTARRATEYYTVTGDGEGKPGKALVGGDDGACGELCQTCRKAGYYNLQ